MMRSEQLRLAPEGAYEGGSALHRTQVPACSMCQVAEVPGEIVGHSMMFEREALNHPSASEVLPRVWRSEFIQAYRSAVERKLKVFTSRENVALSREALRGVLADGNLILRPDAANARLEGTLTISREEVLQEKQIDIKMVAGGCFDLCSAFRVVVPAVPATVFATG
jgi:hypothetical protein